MTAKQESDVLAILRAALTGLALLAMLAGLFIIDGQSKAPRLAGYGCEGAGGVIYAMEESDFPACDRIETIS